MKGRRNKFGAKKAACAQGHSHDSIGEARYCDQLHLLQRAGEIEQLEVHPQYWFVINGKQVKHPNGRRVGFKPDFRYFDRHSGNEIVDDFKGFRTPDYVLRAAIFRALFPTITLRETT